MKSGAVCCILLKLCTRHSFSVLVVSMLSFLLFLPLSLPLFELHCISSALKSYKNVSLCVWRALLSVVLSHEWINNYTFNPL